VDTDRASASAAQTKDATASGDPTITGKLADARRLQDLARSTLAPPARDPLGALDAATQANAAVDAALAALEQRAEARTREAAALTAALSDATARVTRTRDYLTTRGHGIGDRPRAHLAAAEQRLTAASSAQATDPATARRLAGESAQLADEAYFLASREFDGWRQGSGPVAGPYVSAGG